MKNQDSKKELIRLRALGMSYDRIAQTIGVSKPTLLKWNQQCSDEVSNQLYFNVENLLEQYKVLKISRIEAFADNLKKTLEELSKRDLSSLSTKDLVSIALVLENKLKTEVESIKFHTGERGLNFTGDFFDETVLPNSY